MPLTYDWHPYVRMVPANGADATRDLKEEFPDTSGPVRVFAAHEPEFEERENVNRERSIEPFGFRPTCRMVFEIFGMEDHEVIAEIANRAMKTGWTVYLSLDGGTTERAVVLTRYRGPKAIKGKTHIGATYELEFEAVELLAECPAIDEGVW